MCTYAVCVVCVQDHWPWRSKITFGTSNLRDRLTGYLIPNLVKRLTYSVSKLSFFFLFTSVEFSVSLCFFYFDVKRWIRQVLCKILHKVTRDDIIASKIKLVSVWVNWALFELFFYYVSHLLINNKEPTVGFQNQPWKQRSRNSLNLISRYA